MRDFSKKAQIRVFKEDVWKTDTADAYFSKEIRTRDRKCRRCAIKPSQDCSHYWRRDMKGTRFDPDNCIGLCRECHDIWEYQKNDEYKTYMIDWLGPGGYEELEKRARKSMKMRDAVLEFMRRRLSTS